MPEKTRENGNNFELDGVRIVGICGMGGIGKTTIARAIFDRITKSFDAFCFIADVREESKKYTINYLQKQLLCRTLKLQLQNMDISDIGIKDIKSRLCHLRVLLVLDDVDTAEQLEALAGCHDWFGKRSRVIITSRRRDILRGFANEIYEAEGLPENDSIELLCWRAFKQTFPNEGYMEMSKWIVDYTKGNPLALKVLGSFLHGKSKTTWQSAIEKLKRMPKDEIYYVLKISFDDLDREEKDVFLDIACFLWRKKWNYAVEVLDSCGFSAEINLSVLIDRCLVSIQFEEVWMHDLIRQMGQEIVRRESPKELGKQSRLMYFDDIKSVLETNTGTKRVEGLAIESPDSRLIHANSKSFSKMSGLRLLVLEKMLFDGGLQTLPSSIKYMFWEGYPYQHLPLGYNPVDLVHLNMPRSKVNQLWEGTKHLGNLKVLDLRFSRNLISISTELSASTKLEVLLLSGCTSFLEVPQSLGCLKKLRILTMEGCTNLHNFPDSIHWESLKSLILSGCKKLTKFPNILGNMNSTVDIALDGTAIEELPASIDNLKGLVSLNLEGCWLLKHIPNSICNLKYLKTVILTDCSSLKEFPKSLFHLDSLETLSVDKCKALTPWSFKLPSGKCFLHLSHLYLSNCNLVEVTCDIGQLPLLRIVDLSRNKFESLSLGKGKLRSLERLNLNHCENLKSVQLPFLLKILNANSCPSLETIENSSSENCLAVNCSRQFFNLTNCSKLRNQGGNLMKNNILRYHAVIAKMLQNPDFSMIAAYCLNNICFFFTGSDIPNWFTHCALGDCITMELPSPALFNYDLGAILLCIVVQFNSETKPKCVRVQFNFKRQEYYSAKIFCGRIFGWDCEEMDTTFSHHLFLVYMPSNLSVLNTLPPCRISTDFKVLVDGGLTRVRKCGMCLIDTKGEGDNIEAAVFRNTPVDLSPNDVNVFKDHGENLGIPATGEEYITLFGTKLKRSR